MKLWPMQRAVPHIHSGSASNLDSVSGAVHRDHIALEEIRLGTPESGSLHEQPPVPAPRKRGCGWGDWAWLCGGAAGCVAMVFCLLAVTLKKGAGASGHVLCDASKLGANLVCSPVTAAQEGLHGPIPGTPEVHDTAMMQPKRSRGLFATGLAKYQRRPGTLFATCGPSASDVQQGYTGDCYFMSALSVVAHMNPPLVQARLVNSTSQEQFRLFLYNATVDFPTPQYFDLDDKFYMYLGGLAPAYARMPVDPATGEHVLWPALYEKGFALQSGEKANTQGNTGYQSIANGGQPSTAFHAITGAPENYYALSDRNSYGRLANLFACNAMGVFTTPSNASKRLHGMVGGHAYGILGYYNTSDDAVFRLRNPWGAKTPGSGAGVAALGNGVFDITMSRLIETGAVSGVFLAQVG